MHQTTPSASLQSSVCTISQGNSNHSYSVQISGNYVPVTIQTLKTPALIDTGACTNLLSYSFYMMCKQYSSLSLLAPDRYTLRDAQNNAMPIAGKVRVNVQINDLMTPLTFQVVHNLPTNVILGLPFLQATDATIDFSKNIVTMQHGLVMAAMQPSVNNSETFPLLACHDVIIPSKTIMQCSFQIPQSMRHALGNGSRSVVVTPDLTSVHFVDLQMDDSLLPMTIDGIVYCKIANTSVFLKKIPVNTPLLRAFFIDLCDIYPLTTEHATITQNVQKVRTPKTFDPIDWDSILQVPHLDRSHQNQLKHLLEMNRPAFALHLMELGTVKHVQHNIHLKDQSKIIRLRPYKMSTEKQGIVNAELIKLHEAGIIEKCNSPWSSPIVLVKKKALVPNAATRWRICIDYRSLNSATEDENFPLESPDDIFHSISQLKPKYFTVLDLMSCFHQIGINPAHADRTAFCTNTQNWRYVKLPFGLKSGPSTASRAVTECLANLGPYVHSYIDDVIIASPTWEEHLKHLAIVLKRLQQFGFTVHPGKCEWAQPKVVYLGFILSHEGIAPNPSKIKLIQDYPVPTTVKQIRSFVGLMSYYRRYIHRFSNICSPLYDLLKKDIKFEWTEKTQKSFEELKQALLKNVILAHPDLSKDFVITCDASQNTVGHTLSQYDGKFLRPIFFFSRKLHCSQALWHINEKEIFSLILALRLHKHLLCGKKITVFTDNITTKYLQSLKGSSSPKILRWSIEIQDLNLIIKHCPAKLNQVADALSRMVEIPESFSRTIDSASLQVPLNDPEVFAVTRAQTRQAKSVSSPQTIHSRSTIGPKPTHSHINLPHPSNRHTALDPAQLTAAAPQYQYITPRNLPTPNKPTVADIARKSRARHQPDLTTVDIPTSHGDVVSQDQTYLPQLLDNSLVKKVHDSVISNLQSLRHQQRDDPKYKFIIQYLLDGSLPNKRKQATKILSEVQNYVLDDNKVLYHLFRPGGNKDPRTTVAQLAIPVAYVKQIMQAYHDMPAGAHKGFISTLESIRYKYFWPKMSTQIADYIRTCDICARSKRAQDTVKMPLTLREQFPIFYAAHMDVLSLHIDYKNGFSKLLCIIDSFSGITELIPIRAETGAEVAKAFFNSFCLRYAIPRILYTDRHMSFKSNFLAELAKLLGYKHTFISTLHPASNSKVESLNRRILSLLRTMSGRNANWTALLPVVQFHLNNTVSSTTGFSPHFLAYGFQPHMAEIPDLLDPKVLPLASKQIIQSIIPELALYRELARLNALDSQQKAKIQYDKRHKTGTIEFEIGEKVYLTSGRVAGQPTSKLKLYFSGPYLIIDKLSDTLYALEEVNSHKRYPSLVHSDRLRHYYDKQLSEIRNL